MENSSSAKFSFTKALRSFKDFNRVVKTMVVVDFFTNYAFGSFAPIFAVFVTNQIGGGSVEVAGFATSVYWIVKSIFQLPIAKVLDRRNGEVLAFWAMFWGYFLESFVPLLYILVRTPMELYLVQALYGFLMAWAVPSWYGIFTRHVDKWRISFEWSLESVISVGLATAGAAALGGYLASRYGFQILFVAASVISLAISMLFLSIRKDMLKWNPPQAVNPERPVDKV
ncbi:MFS transporter [Patescibacteria group bacterium]|nr:MFS transporter [Patescibacteria group bacterium]